MAYNYQLLVKQLFLNPVQNNPDEKIIFKDEFEYTYGQFRKRVCRLANALIKIGIKKGDTVAILDYDTHRYLECYFAIPMIGAIMHTINVRLSPEQILYTIEHAEDDMLLVHGDFIPLLEQTRSRMNVEKFIFLGSNQDAKNTILPIYDEYENWIKNEKDSFDFEDFDENTRATIFYTTGTTGMPKGVYFSHRQLVLHTINTLATLGSNPSQNINSSDVYMPMTPMFHVHAWGFPYLATYLGMKQIYPGKYIPERLLKLLQKHKVTISHCVPTILHMLLNAPGFDKIDLKGWKVIIGGASLPKSICLAAMKQGIDIFAGYGMSETCPVLSISQLTPEMMRLDPDKQADMRVKAGRSVGLVELRVVDENMNDVKADGQSTGEIIVRAPWLTKGYFKDTKNSEILWKNDYLHTGDMANIDENGYIKITDRAKDIIKVGGEWVSSLELEDIISLHSSVKEVAVIGIEDEKWSERPLALVVLKENKDEQQAKKEILSHAKEYIKKGIMARESLLLKIQIVENIQKTSVGKIDKKNLRLKYK
ncbi:MAG: long-chain fatty acid--CoA ligase [Proteobacteria bacterium]|nr:MAG: long-chain fatty acid--CoA ligase [Pseudomonadota bacterium]